MCAGHSLLTLSFTFTSSVLAPNFTATLTIHLPLTAVQNPVLKLLYMLFHPHSFPPLLT